MDKNVKRKKETRQWRTGDYLRLSKENLTAGTSLSIENQKAIIRDFLDADPLQFMHVDTYIEMITSSLIQSHYKGAKSKTPERPRLSGVLGK